ncbi:MAG: hypothetical protein Q9221_002854 [Calogaya cf. arnoldii]
MNNADAAALLTCATFASGLWYLSPTRSLFTPGWLAFFCLVRFKDEIRWSLEESVPWLSPLKIVCIIALCLFIYIVSSNFFGGRSATHSGPLHENIEQDDSEYLLKPLLFPARTTHTRFFPQKHSFSYSYLLVGVPVGWRGALRSYLAVDLPFDSSPSWTGFMNSWFSVNADDYLERGSESLGLQGKLHSYLRSQGEAIDDYPYAYLVTAPRFLGYSFNPVSFWYLYNAQKELRAMILEVNNTFDERRLYFLKGGHGNPKDEHATDPSPIKFKDNWAKDFHVSPFNSRKGSYALNAYDPFSPNLSGTGMIDNTITLSSSKSHAKLVARVFSTEASSDPATIGYWTSLRFIAAWWWVGFVTFPRIVREAGKLYFRRKLHVWYRPEVLKDTIGRRATNDEIVIESTFRTFLRYVMANSQIDRSLRYVSFNPSSPTSETLYPQTAEFQSQSKGVMEFRITTPLFFARLARYSHISEFLSNEILANDDKDRTFYTSHPQILLQLFEDASTLLRPPTDHSLLSNRLSWRFLRWLRKRRPYQVQSCENQQLHVKIDIRHLSFSELDSFAMIHESPPGKAKYIRAVTKILISDIMAFGYPELLDALAYGLKILASYVIVDGVTACWYDVLGEWTTVAL